MPEHPSDAEQKLKKLGERVRDGFAKENPIPDKSLETVRDAVREQWEQQRRSTPGRNSEDHPTRERQREPEDPGPTP